MLKREQVGPAIIAALTPVGLPLYPDACTVSTPPAEYVVFIVGACPVLFEVDNAPILWTQEVEINVMSPKYLDTDPRIGQMQSLLAAAGFEYPEIIDQIYEPDTKKRHLIMATSIVVEA